MVRLLQIILCLGGLFFSWVGFAQGGGRSFDHAEFQRRVQKRAAVHSKTSAVVAAPQAQDLRPSRIAPEWMLWVTAPEQRVGVTSKTSSTERHFNKNQPLTLFHPQTQNLGKLTGNLKLHILKPQHSQLAELLKAYDLQLLAAFPDIDTYFVTPKQDEFDFEQLNQQLSSDSRIHAVTAEVLSRVYERK